MNRYVWRIILFATLTTPLLLNAAETTLTYTLSAPLPGGENTVGGQSQLSPFAQYIGYLFPFLLSFAALAALVMFVYGGMVYASAGGSADRVKSAREYITNAILGLLLAVFSVLILQTINPALTKLEIPSITDVGVGPSVTPGPSGRPVDSSCDLDSECASGLCRASICYSANLDTGKDCVVGEQCGSGVCDRPSIISRLQCLE